MAARGTYVAFEGGEGCGKSTQAQMLADKVGALVTREPGGTPLGAELRRLVLTPGEAPVSPRAETLLMAADRAQHMVEVVEPALAVGRHVISDRTVFLPSPIRAAAESLASTPFTASTIGPSTATGLTSLSCSISTLPLPACGWTGAWIGSNKRRSTFTYVCGRRFWNWPPPTPIDGSLCPEHHRSKKWRPLCWMRSARGSAND